MHINLKLYWLHVLFLLAAVALISACTGAKGQGPEPAPRSWTQVDLERVVEKWREKSGVPGVVVGISLPEHPEIIIPKGESNIEAGILLGKDDQFRIASITKTFIAAEVLRLVAGGDIDLDDSLHVYLTGIPHGNVVTIRHLLSHRSGYFDPVHDDPGFIPYIAEHLQKQWTWDELLEISFQHNLFFEPGSDYRYSNTNYILLGLVIEEVTQRTLREALTSDLIVPFQLEHTVYTTVATDTKPMDLVRGYIVHPITGEIIDGTTIPYKSIVSASADTMVSNAQDLLKWSRLLYGNTSQIFEPGLKEQMLTFTGDNPYGFGVFRFDTPVGASYGHGGDTAGYLSLMEYFPKQDMAMVILVNTDAPSTNLSELRNLLLGQLYLVDLNVDIEDLILDIKSEDTSTRKEAIIALGHSGTNLDEAVLALILVLREDTSAENRKEAALALGFVGKGSAQAKQALTQALSDKDEMVREAAQLALSVLE